jgi:RNA polymerase sigma-70 factor (ECF subfamily)
VTNLTAPVEVDVRDLEAEFERHRVALTGYCYRMLGSAFDADDAVQETMVRAWRGLSRFEGRAALRSWIFRIATNVCFDMLKGRGRRALPMDLGPASSGDTPADAPSGEVSWLQPVPDNRVVAADDPAEMSSSRESVRLAFVAALQHLPPRQRAVLVLRDVLAWQATEVAVLLGTTPTSVHSALQRARRSLAGRDLGTPPAPMDAEHRALLDRYVDAFERYDVEALVALLHHDATMSMPPLTLWLRGPDAIGRWWRGHGAACRGGRLMPSPVQANGSAAFGLYRRAAGDMGIDFGLQVVELAEGRIRGIHTFLDADLAGLFGLPTVVDGVDP